MKIARVNTELARISSVDMRGKNPLFKDDKFLANLFLKTGLPSLSSPNSNCSKWKWNHQIHNFKVPHHDPLLVPLTHDGRAIRQDIMPKPHTKSKN